MDGGVPTDNEGKFVKIFSSIVRFTSGSAVIAPAVKPAVLPGHCDPAGHAVADGPLPASGAAPFRPASIDGGALRAAQDGGSPFCTIAG